MPQTTKASRLRQELRRELPRLLREDLEVRGQVIGLLSEYLTTREETAAILAELRQMREAFDRRMDEHGRRLEEQGRRLEEQGQRIEEQGRRIEEQGQRIDTHTRMLGAIGARWGILNEQAFRSGASALLSAQPGVQVERWLYQDKQGQVFGYPAEVEVDAVIHDGMHMLVAIKSLVSRADVSTFARKAELYAAVSGHKPQRRMIISPFVDAAAVEAAKHFDIEVHTSLSSPAV
jgi:hypothetical protein